MARRQPICAAMALLLLSTWGWAADAPEPQSGAKPPDGQAFGDIQSRLTGEPVLVTETERCSDWDVRFGWWGMSHTGSAAKVGEYQDLSSSPFFDVDGFSSNGTRTLAVTATGSDQDTDSGKLYYYQPGVTAKVDYERFLHRAGSRSAEQHGLRPAPRRPALPPPTRKSSSRTSAPGRTTRCGCRN